MNLLPRTSARHFYSSARQFSMAVLATLALVASASADISDLQTLITSQNPDQWLQFNNNLSNSGSGAASFSAFSGGFGPDADANANAARSYTSSGDVVTTTTDVIGNTGSVSLLYRVPDVPFSADRYLFDGGVDEPISNDQAFNLRWDDNPGELEMRLGNTTFPLNGPGGTPLNVENFAGQWLYFGLTWDMDVDSQEATGIVGVPDGSVYVTPINPANASLAGDGGNFAIGNIEDPFDQTRAWRQTDVTPGDGTGFIDEFAIWNTQLEPGQLAAQWDYFNGNLPDPPAPGVIADNFSDGTRESSAGGLNWYRMGGTTSSGNPTPLLSVVPDGQGIGDGNALYVDANSSNSEVQAVFGEEVALGSTVGSTVSVSFDMRLDGALPSSAEFRFGIFGDTDNEFGTNGWGESDGDFDRDPPGALGDAGSFARVQLGTDPTLNGDQTRVVEHINTTDTIGGSGSDTVAQAEAGAFEVIDDNEVRSFELLLTRTAPDATTGDDVMLTLTMDGSTLSGLDSTISTSENSSADIFDYFVAKTTVNLNWVLDNFLVEVEDATGNPLDPDGSGFIDGADFLALQRDNSSLIASWQTAYGTSAAVGSVAAVPEPTAFALLLGCVLIPVYRRSRDEIE